MKFNPHTDADKPFWFVMVAYKRELPACESLTQRGMEAFVPMQTVVRERAGRKTRLQVPAIATVVFVHDTWTRLMEAKKEMAYLKFRMCDTSEGREYLIVPDGQMRDFIRVCQSSGDLQFLEPGELTISRGTRVRILGGPLDGVEGTFQRVKGKRSRRLVVTLDGFCGVAAEVSPDLVELLDS